MMEFSVLNVVVLVCCYLAVGALLGLLWAINDLMAEVGLMIVFWPLMLVALICIATVEAIEDLAWGIKDKRRMNR